MALVRESLYNFHKTGDVKSGLNIGILSKIKNAIANFLDESPDYTNEEIIDKISVIIEQFGVIRLPKELKDIEEWVYFISSQLDSINENTISNIADLYLEEVIKPQKFVDSLKEGIKIYPNDFNFIFTKLDGELIIYFDEFSDFYDLFYENREVSKEFILNILKGDSYQYFQEQPYDLEETVNLLQNIGNEKTWQLLEDLAKSKNLDFNKESEKSLKIFISNPDIRSIINETIMDADFISWESTVYDEIVKKILSFYEMKPTDKNINDEKLNYSISGDAFFGIISSYSYILGNSLRWTMRESDFSDYHYISTEDFNRILEEKI